MQRFLTLALSIIVCSTTLAQDIRLGLYPVKAPMNELVASQMTALHTKLRGWMSVGELVVADIHAPVGIVPELIFGEPRTVAAGMKNLTVYEAELVLTIQQINGNPTFGSYTKKLSASGNDAKAAKKELLSKLPSSDAGFEAFLRQTLPEITAYYAGHCQEIKAEAESLSSRGEFDKALSMLVNIPASLPCREASKSMFLGIYEKRRDAICGQTLLRAKAAAAKKDYDGAVRALHGIDPTASCFPDAMAYVEELKASADADFLAKLDLVKSYYEAKANLEEQRHVIVRDFLMTKQF